MPTDYEIRVTPDLPALHRDAVAEIYRCASEAINSRGRFSIALSGGNTPRDVYALLATEHKNDLPWDKVFVFFGDERQVASDDPQSNYRMADEALLSKVDLPSGNIFRVPTELGPQAAAEEYEKRLRAYFHLASGAFPAFDLILLGLGDDGHTASLFPESAALQEDLKTFVANWVEKMQTWRLTLTFPVLNNGQEVLFLVGGRSKAPVLKAILDPASRASLPAQMVRPRGRLVWLLDAEAASLLPATL